jgi:hypothetical protein
MMRRSEKRRSAMNLMTDDLQATLRNGQTLCLHDALGMEIRVREGSLWLTQDRDAKDYVITAGGSFRIDRQGAVVLTACEGVRLDFLPRRAPARFLQLAASC